MSSPRSSAAALLALSLVAVALTGCIATEDAPAQTVAPTSNTSNSTTFVNPTGTTSAAAVETNKTVVGKGGIEHLHDYWEGETEKILVEEDVNLFTPLFCDNGDTSKVGCAVIRLPVTDPATLVYEGAGQVVVTISAFGPNVQAVEMSWKNGADPTWRASVPLAPDQPHVIDLTPLDTDMPHASASQWAWRFVGKPAIPFGNPNGPDFHLQIKVVKSGKIVDWPGHPDFYADKPYRVVLDKDGTTSTNGIHDGFLYGNENNIVRPELLISSGTGKITIYLNVTDVRAPTGEVKPNSFFMEYTNATGYWEGDYDESGFGNNRVFGNNTAPGQYVIDIPVKYTGWDSPYAPSSGWQFLIKSDYSGFCNGCLPYEVDFHMTIIAYPDPQYVGGDALE